MGAAPAAVWAQPAPAAPAAPAAIPFATVAEARKAIESNAGDEYIVTHSDGWIIANQPLAAAQWSFTPEGYFAYPAVVRRVIRRSAAGDVSVEISTVCEASADACRRLVDDFEKLNERIKQSIKSRQRATPPAPMPMPPAAR